MTNFVECDACRSKPGMPVLCSGCRQNRKAIDTLEAIVQRLSASCFVTKDQAEQMEDAARLEKRVKAGRAILVVEQDPKALSQTGNTGEPSEVIWLRDGRVVGDTICGTLAQAAELILDTGLEGFEDDRS